MPRMHANHGRLASLLNNEEEAVRSRFSSSAVTRLLLAGCSTALAVLVLSSTASAATTPTAFTNCWGSVAADSGGKANDEPNLLGYKFHCNYSITDYTVIVSQTGDRQFGGTIDDYGTPAVFEADGKTPSPTETITCDGTTPGYGINCNYGTVGASMTAGFWADGTIDPTAPYCKHLPTDANGQTITKPGTVAIPKATVSLVVTDTIGGQDGPFILGHAKSCPKVPNVVKAPKTKTKTAKHSKRSGHKHKGQHA
jgi:hypothetical protein